MEKGAKKKSRREKFGAVLQIMVSDFADQLIPDATAEDRKEWIDEALKFCYEIPNRKVRVSFDCLVNTQFSLDIGAIKDAIESQEYDEEDTEYLRIHLELCRTSGFVYAHRDVAIVTDRAEIAYDQYVRYPDGWAADRRS
jgi:hypothetical protein